MVLAHTLIEGVAFVCPEQKGAANKRRMNRASRYPPTRLRTPNHEALRAFPAQFFIFLVKNSL
jgi:hypothetical protein